MPPPTLRLLILLPAFLATVLHLVFRLHPDPSATPRCANPGHRHALRQPLLAARRAIYTSPHQTPNTSCRRALVARVQTPQSTPPRLKSFLEKTLTAHARPQFTDPQRLHSHPNRRPMQTPARWVKGLAT